MSRKKHEQVNFNLRNPTHNNINCDELYDTIQLELQKALVVINGFILLALTSDHRFMKFCLQIKDNMMPLLTTKLALIKNNNTGE